MQCASRMGLVMELLLASMERPPAPALPNLVFGIMVMFIGAIVVRRRKQIYEATARGEKRWFGRGVGELLERLQSPFWVGAAGATGVLMGVVMICYAVWKFFH